MKTNQFKTKLHLSKKTITNLTGKMDEVKAGADLSGPGACTSEWYTFCYCWSDQATCPAKLTKCAGTCDTCGNNYC